jgi:predicted flavoprotein YhiN
VALRPDLDMKELIAKVSVPRGKQSLSNFLRKAVSLSPVAIGLLQEAAKTSGTSLASLSPADLANLINAVPIELTGVAPIARAISTAGGIAFSEIDAGFMIRRLPGVFVSRRDAGLGSADRRLSAAGVVCDRGQRRGVRVKVA